MTVLDLPLILAICVVTAHREVCLRDWHFASFLCILACWVMKMVYSWLTRNWIPIWCLCLCQDLPRSHSTTMLSDVRDRQRKYRFITLHSTRHSKGFCWIVISASIWQWYLNSRIHQAVPRLQIATATTTSVDLMILLPKVKHGSRNKVTEAAAKLLNTVSLKVCASTCMFKIQKYFLTCWDTIPQTNDFLAWTLWDYAIAYFKCILVWAINHILSYGHKLISYRE